uniref:Uncharacterized protein n=1 Tax=Syphacia muris TaxID=451379 RepID=A0A0N5AJ95_9BILA
MVWQAAERRVEEDKNLKKTGKCVQNYATATDTQQRMTGFGTPRNTTYEAEAGEFTVDASLSFWMRSCTLNDCAFTALIPYILWIML